MEEELRMKERLRDEERLTTPVPSKSQDSSGRRIDRSRFGENRRVHILVLVFGRRKQPAAGHRPAAREQLVVVVVDIVSVAASTISGAEGQGQKPRT